MTEENVLTSDWSQQIQRANEILSSSDKVIYLNKHGTRLGATYSTIQQALKNGLKLVVFEPYHTIIEKTIIPAAEGYSVGHLKAIDKMCHRHTKVGNIALKGKCSKCPDTDICRLQTFLNNDYDVTAMTYSKVLLVNQFESADNIIINNKILNSDVIFMDEFSHAVHVAPYETDIEQLKNIFLKINDFESMDIIVKFLYEVRGDEFYYSSILKDDFKGFLKYYKKLMSYASNKQDIKCIESFLYSMQYDHFYIMDGKIIPDVTHPLKTFNNLINFFKGKVIITDALLPTTKLLKGTNMEWQDYKNTQSKQLIICDTRKAPFGVYQSNIKKYGRDYYEQLERLRKFVWYQALNFEPKNIQIFSVNTAVAEAIRGFKYDDLNTDDIQISEYDRPSWYRSDLTAGIDMDKRIMIGINLPFTPTDSMSGYAKVFAKLPEYKYLHENIMEYLSDGWETNHTDNLYENALHAQIRKDEMLNTFFNTIGRVKDKNGIAKSVVMIFGSTEDEVRNCLPKGNWNIVSTTSSYFNEETALISRLWLDNDIDVNDIPNIAKLVRYITNDPKKEYNIRKITNDIRIENLKDLVLKYKDILKWIKIKENKFVISDDYLMGSKFKKEEDKIFYKTAKKILLTI